jgi:hypothetical protein
MEPPPALLFRHSGTNRQEGAGQSDRNRPTPLKAPDAGHAVHS